MALITIIEHVLMILQDHDKTEEEILWVGLGYKCGIRDPHSSVITWEEFKKNMGDFDASEASQIPYGTVIVGKDFWVERHYEYALEYWQYREFPKKPGTSRNSHETSKQDE